MSSHREKCVFRKRDCTVKLVNAPFRSPDLGPKILLQFSDKFLACPILFDKNFPNLFRNYERFLDILDSVFPQHVGKVLDFLDWNSRCPEAFRQFRSALDIINALFPKRIGKVLDLLDWNSRCPEAFRQFRSALDIINALFPKRIGKVLDLLDWNSRCPEAFRQFRYGFKILMVSQHIQVRFRQPFRHRYRLVHISTPDKVSEFAEGVLPQSSED